VRLVNSARFEKNKCQGLSFFFPPLLILFTLSGRYIHILPTLKQLRAKLTAAKAEIARLQQQNAYPREGLARVSPATELLAVNPSAATHPPERPWQCQPSQKWPSPSDSELPPPAKVVGPNTTKPLEPSSYI
jgi:hypothetical protein